MTHARNDHFVEVHPPLSCYQLSYRSWRGFCTRTCRRTRRTPTATRCCSWLLNRLVLRQFRAVLEALSLHRSPELSALASNVHAKSSFSAHARPPEKVASNACSSCRCQYVTCNPGRKGVHYLCPSTTVPSPATCNRPNLLSSCVQSSCSEHKDFLPHMRFCPPYPHQSPSMHPCMYE